MFKLLTTGDEFDVLGVYAKGKNLKGIRFLLENKRTKEQEIFFIDDSTTSHYGSPHPFGIDFGFVSEFKWVTKTHIKNKNYNYYYIDNDITKPMTHLLLLSPFIIITLICGAVTVLYLIDKIINE